MKTAPPHHIPNDLVPKYTLAGKIPLLKWYMDDTVSQPLRISGLDYKRALRELDNGTFVYYGQEMQQFYDAFAEYAFIGKTVLVWGLAACNCEAMALWHKAAHVYVVDYNSPVCEHEKITVLNHEQLAQSGITTDIAISYSSFEHDGLGRYGDPLNPDGDLAAMKAASLYLKDNGLLFLGVPLGQDALCFNAHRIYGGLRLPMLLEGWRLNDVYSIYGDIFSKELGSYPQALLVLRKMLPQNISKPDIKKELTNSLHECLKRIQAIRQDFSRADSPQRLAHLKRRLNSATIQAEIIQFQIGHLA